MRFLINFAWQDLRESGHSLWVFCTCIALGVCLVAATGGLYRLIGDAMLADTRALMGGDVEIESDAPLPDEVMQWMQDNAMVSTLVELDTMMGTASDRFQRVEVQSVDEAYPLYGELVLAPVPEVDEATRRVEGQWGAAVDGPLAERLGLQVGDEIYIGNLSMKVRARIREQPDRNLSADWRGAPVIIAREALDASGLVRPTSRIEYDNRIRTDEDAEAWERRFLETFPDNDWEVRTFSDRSERIAERLGQMASALLIIGLSTLFIGGLGVFNSIHAYLQGKLGTIATLRALGLRNRRLAGVYLLQVGMLSGVSSIAGALIGFALALAGAAVVAAEVPLTTTASSLGPPLVMALCFGLLTAFTFAMPAIGRALSVDPAALFRNLEGVHTATPRGWWLATLILCLLLITLVQLVLPDPLFGLGFIAVVGLLLAVLDLVVRLLRRGAIALQDHPALGRRFSLRLAMANLHRPGSPLRASLLSLGSALTLLVICTLVVGSLIRAINDTIPSEAPALVLYDVAADQRQAVTDGIRQAAPEARVELAPLVRGRLSHVNGEALSDSPDPRIRSEARDEHKLSYQANNIDGVTLQRGAWWNTATPDRLRIAMEDREANQLGLQVGDRLRFAIEGRSLEAELSGIYSQKGIQTRFWFEGIVSRPGLDPFIYQYVGAAYMSHEAAARVQAALGRIAPNVITVRTESILTSARDILGKATAGLAVVAGVSLAVSLLVLTAVMATTRTRQVYDATILHSLGARLTAIRSSLQMEYLLLALITSGFAVLLGSAVALPLLSYRIKLPAQDLVWLGAVTAVSVSAICLTLGAKVLLRRMQLSPAILLRSGG